jgi:hypothetical protein
MAILPADIAEAAKHGLKAGDRKYIYNADGSNYYSIIGRQIQNGPVLSAVPSGIKTGIFHLISALYRV